MPERRTWMAAMTAVITIAGFTLAACGGDSDDSDAGDTTPTPSSSSSSPTSSAPAPAGLAGRLMYSRFDEATHTFISTHIAEADGSNETELALPGPEGGGRWSTSGDQIAVMTILDDGRVGTAIITPDGTVDRVLEIPDPSLNLVCVAWSPDDGRLACEAWDDSEPSRRGIYTVRSSDGGDLTRLTTSPKGKADYPGDYSPDGKQLVFKRTTEEEPGPLMLVPVTGGEPRRLSTELVEDDGRFSPDGVSVLTSQRGSIMAIDLNGKVRYEFSTPGTYSFGPAWSPDGKWVTFSRGTDGPFADIFISRPDGDEEFQVTDTAVNEIALDWGAG